MTGKSGGKSAPTKSSSEPRIVHCQGLAALEENIRKAIAYRAYELYESRGRSAGHDMEDWFEAEKELVKLSDVEIRDSGAQVRLRAGVPGFTAIEIQIGVAPQRLIIWGEKARTDAPGVVRLLDEVALPAPIDAAKAAAEVSDGVLQFRAPKNQSSGE